MMQYPSLLIVALHREAAERSPYRHRSLIMHARDAPLQAHGWVAASRPYTRLSLAVLLGLDLLPLYHSLVTT
jgi:hypothetical protein